MQPLLIADREFERLFVAGDDNHFADAIQEHGTTTAMGKVACPHSRGSSLTPTSPG
jgi:CMP-2-keto-3-deoxyoctulosonic acid synthetase